MLVISFDKAGPAVADSLRKRFPRNDVETSTLLSMRQFEIEARIIQLPPKRSAGDPEPADTQGRILSSTELAQTLSALSMIPEAEVLSAPRLLTIERPKETPSIHVTTITPYVTRAWVDTRGEVQADFKNLDVGVVLETVPARMPDGRIQVDFALVLGCVVDRRPVVMENPSGIVLDATQADRHQGLGTPVVDEKSLSRTVALQDGETYAVQVEGYEPGLHQRLLKVEPPLRGRRSTDDRLFLFLTVNQLPPDVQHTRATPNSPRSDPFAFRGGPDAQARGAKQEEERRIAAEAAARAAEAAARERSGAQFHVETHLFELPSRRSDSDPIDIHGRVLSKSERETLFVSLTTSGKAKLLANPRIITFAKPARIDIGGPQSSIKRAWVDHEGKIQTEMNHFVAGVALEVSPTPLADGRIQLDVAVVAADVLDRSPYRLDARKGAGLSASDEAMLASGGTPVVFERSLSRRAVLTSGETFGVEVDGYEPGLYQRLTKSEPPPRTDRIPDHGRLLLFLTVDQLGGNGQRPRPTPQPPGSFLWDGVTSRE